MPTEPTVLHREADDAIREHAERVARLAARPPMPDWAPEFAAEEEPDSRWRVQSHGQCRARLDGPGHIYCRLPAVAALNRGFRKRDSWWAYCGDHLYGRWVEDGKVMHWRAVFGGANDAPKP